MQIGSMRWLFAAILGAIAVSAGLTVEAGLKAGAQAAPGTILEAEGDRLIVATGDGPLRITEIQP